MINKKVEIMPFSEDSKNAIKTLNYCVSFV